MVLQRSCSNTSIKALPLGCNMYPAMSIIYSLYLSLWANTSNIFIRHPLHLYVRSESSSVVYLTNPAHAGGRNPSGSK